MSEKFSAVKGMNDILPDTSYQWQYLEAKLAIWLNSYGYQNIRTPIVEHTRLFSRSIGEVTDIVEKEMYSFTDSLNGDQLTLRPEGTAAIVRAVVEHNLLYNAPQKLWSIGPMFRHERPQKGRYRQFYQLGVEALGFAGPDIDCEIILMVEELWRSLGLTNIELHINCLGNTAERSTHRTALINYLSDNLDSLDEDAKRRLHSNPLRILDSKNPAMQELINAAPKLIDYLGEQSLAHYTQWKTSLDKLVIKYTENPRLVRGLDYYNLSVFEWMSDSLGSQATVCGGGRYDPLIAQLGGKDSYALGFGMGLERLLLLLEAQNKLPAKPQPQIFIVNEGEGASDYAFKLAQQLREYGYRVVQNFGGGSFKAQFKRADNSNSPVTLVIGEQEVLNRQVVVKDMQQKQQQTIAQEDLLAHLNDLFGELAKI